MRQSWRPFHSRRRWNQQRSGETFATVIWHD